MGVSFFCKGDNTYHYKSELPKTLQPYYNSSFLSGGETDEGFFVFDAKYKRVLKKLLPEGYTIHSWNTNHYETFWVIKTPDDKFIYCRYSDVRYWPNEWCSNILIRTMEHEKDWTGGPNRYTTLFMFTKDVQKIWG